MNLDIIKNDIYFTVRTNYSINPHDTVKKKLLSKGIKAITECRIFNKERTEDCYNYLLMMSPNSRNKLFWKAEHIDMVNDYTSSTNFGFINQTLQK